MEAGGAPLRDVPRAGHPTERTPPVVPVDSTPLMSRRAAVPPARPPGPWTPTLSSNPQLVQGLAGLLLRAPGHSLRSAYKVSGIDSFGLSTFLLTSHHHFAAAACRIFFSALREKVMRALKKIQQAVGRWQLVVSVGWQRFQGRVSGLYYRRVSGPLRFWRAAGCPRQFRPSLPWWQPFVYRWLVVSGWLRR